MADITHISINNTSYDIKDAKAARKGMYVGTCPSSASIGGSTVTMASSPDKVVTVDTFPTDANGKPLVGTIIGVKYATTNTYKTDLDNNKPEAPHRINVNNTGFIQIYYNNAALKSGTSANSLAAGYKNRYIYYQYDGTYWVWLSAGTDTNTTYSGYSFGLGLGVQNNASASATITVTLSNYALATGGVTAVRFLYDVPATSTMNINSKGAKSIYYKNAAIGAGVIKAGDTATFVYSSQYHLIAIDRWDDDIKAKANSADLATVATSGSYNDLSNKPTIPAAVTVDSALSSSSTNPVQNKKVYEALQGKLGDGDVNVSTPSTPNGTVVFTVGSNTFTINLNHTHDNIPTVDSSLTGSSQTNPVQGGAIYSALQGKEDRQVTIIRVAMDMDDDATLHFSDDENNSLTSSQVRELITNEKKDITLRFDYSYTGADVETVSDKLIFYPSSFDENDDYFEFYAVEDGVRRVLYTLGLGIYEDDAVTYLDYIAKTELVATSDLSSYVPTTRKINNKALSSDITLTASDVGAMSTSHPANAITSAKITEWNGKADPVPIVTVSTTGAVTQALDPNKFYDFTGSPTSLTLTLNSGTGLCIYAGKFTAGTGFSNLTLPSTVKVADGAPSVEAGGVYEFSVLDNLLLLAKEGE